MNLDVAPQELHWLKRFFSGKNQLSWQSIESYQATANNLAQVIPWLKFLRGSTIDFPIVLPLYGSDGSMSWYGMANGDQMFSQLIEEINSFIGPSYSDFKGEWLEHTTNNDSELALIERFGTRVLRFSGQRPDDHPSIERSLLLYNSLLSRRPSIPDRTQRPFGKIRSEFDLSLLTGNASRAQGLLDELISTGRVNAEQKKCLEVRLLAGLGRQEELARNQTLILSIADLSLPAQILVDVVDALYQIYIQPIEANPSVEEVTAAFRQHISRPFGSLFKGRKGIRQPTVLRSFLLFELVQSEPSTMRCESIITAYAEKAEGRDLADRWYCFFLKNISNSRPVVESRSSLDIARQAIADEDYNTACKLCFDLLPNFWAYCALLRCAIELSSPDITQRVLKAVNATTSDVRSRFTPKDLARLVALQDYGKVLNFSQDLGWIRWAQNVERGEFRESAITILKENVVKWSIEEYALDTKRCIFLAQLIGNAKVDVEAVYREAFPFLVEFFVERPRQTCRAFMPIYATLLKILGWSGALSTDELEIATSLVEIMLKIGPSSEEYRECMEDLREIVCANNSPVHLDWALNTVELLILYPVQDGGEIRLRVFMEVVSAAQMSMHRVTFAQREVFGILAQDYDCLGLLETWPKPEEAKGDAVEAYNKYDGLIGIYTLTESAGQRAKDILERYFPNARVETNKDSVATDRLTSLAKNADVFVFAWKSSKHEAYYCVKEARREGEIIMPPGKGTASIVRSALESVSMKY